MRQCSTFPPPPPLNLIFNFNAILDISVKTTTEYLKVTLGLVKRLEIGKQLKYECVTVPGYVAACHCQLTAAK